MDQMRDNGVFVIHWDIHWVILRVFLVLYLGQKYILMGVIFQSEDFKFTVLKAYN